ncbi:MAG TPA: hypothetical protein VLB84_16415, partial [Bacteroidia bacterium]|nr:hypothetical protein [Bacteroidia bacterium]
MLQRLDKVIAKNFRDKNETNALLSHCMALSESNDAGGQYCLATFYFYGAGGLEKDKQKWLELIRKSAEQDYPISVFYMGNE